MCRDTSYQPLDLKALLIAQLTARHISSACVETGKAEFIDGDAFAHRAPAAVVEDLEAAVLRRHVCCKDAVSQPDVTLLCTELHLAKNVQLD